MHDGHEHHQGSLAPAWELKNAEQATPTPRSDCLSVRRTTSRRDRTDHRDPACSTDHRDHSKGPSRSNRRYRTKELPRAAEFQTYACPLLFPQNTLPRVRAIVVIRPIGAILSSGRQCRQGKKRRGWALAHSASRFLRGVVRRTLLVATYFAQGSQGSAQGSASQGSAHGSQPQQPTMPSERTARSRRVPNLRIAFPSCCAAGA